MSVLDLSGSGTLTLSSPVITGGVLNLGGVGILGLTAPAHGKRRRTIAVDMNGNPIGELGDVATHGDIIYELGAVDDWSFTFPAEHATRAELVLGAEFREWQLYRGKQLLAWGPQTSYGQEGPSGLMRVRGSDPRWYLDRRFIGKVDRQNHIVNGSFEDGLTGWSIPVYSVIEPQANLTGLNVLWSISTTQHVSGAQSLRMEWPNTTNPQYGFMTQQFFVWDVDPDENPNGDDWTFAVRFKIDDAAFVGPPFNNIGATILRASTTETTTVTRPGGIPEIYPRVIESRFIFIDETTARGKWVTATVELTQPVTGDPEFVLIELWSPNGVIYWDKIVLAREETLSFYGTDEAQIVQGIAEHLQDPAFDKSDVNLSYDCPNTGVLLDRVYSFAMHPPGWRSMTELMTLDTGLDIGIRFTSVDRILTTRFPEMGTYDPNSPIKREQLSHWTWTFDGEAAANANMQLGEGFGVTREEGFALDLAAFDGLVLERIEQAPLETPIDSLDARASERVAITLNPELLVVTTVPDSSHCGTLFLGDTRDVSIVDGGLIINARYRVVRLTWHENDALTLVLNRRVT